MSMPPKCDRCGRPAPECEPQCEIDGLREELEAANLQVEELQKKLDRRDHDLYLHWKEGFEKQGFTLHAGLTPEQNAAEWKEQTNRLNEAMRSTLDTIRFGMQKHFGLEYLKKATVAVKDAGECTELGVWVWYCANHMLTAIERGEAVVRSISEKPKSEKVAYCSSCGAFNEAAHKEGCGFIEKRNHETA